MPELTQDQLMALHAGHVFVRGGACVWCGATAWICLQCHEEEGPEHACPLEARDA